MVYDVYELLWLFLIYSFAGWLLETIVAAAKQKRFVNRGVINLPFCVIYGFGAVFITIFGKGLSGIWLFIGSVVLVIVFSNLAGGLIKKLYHEQWWDYSDKKGNLGEYMSLPIAAILGCIAMVVIKWGNPLFIKLFHVMPKLLGIILVFAMVIILIVDATATWLVLHGEQKKAESWAKVDRKFDRFTHKVSGKIYVHIDKRVKKAYPKSREDVTEELETHQNVFAYGCSFYKIVWLFFIGAFGGDIVETIFCRITDGVWMSRSSVVWGPFSIVWGLAIACATLLLHKYRNKSDGSIFFAGVFLGGVYEYVCSVFTELVFGKVFWDYSKIPFNLGGRINLLYCFFWGIAAVVWIKYLYPKISSLIERVPVKAGKFMTWIFIIFMCANMIVSALALIRSTQRANGEPAERQWQELMDEWYDDETLQRIYPNAINRN